MSSPEVNENKVVLQGEEGKVLHLKAYPYATRLYALAAVRRRLFQKYSPVDHPPAQDQLGHLTRGQFSAVGEEGNWMYTGLLFDTPFQLPDGIVGE